MYNIHLTAEVTDLDKLIEEIHKERKAMQEEQKSQFIQTCFGQTREGKKHRYTLLDYDWIRRTWLVRRDDAFRLLLTKSDAYTLKYIDGPIEMTRKEVKVHRIKVYRDFVPPGYSPDQWFRTLLETAEYTENAYTLQCEILDLYKPENSPWMVPCVEPV